MVEPAILSHCLDDLSGSAPPLLGRLVEVISPKFFISLTQEDSALFSVSIRYNHKSILHSGKSAMQQLRPLTSAGPARARR